MRLEIKKGKSLTGAYCISLVHDMRHQMHEKLHFISVVFDLRIVYWYMESIKTKTKLKKSASSVWVRLQHLQLTSTKITQIEVYEYVAFFPKKRQS